MATNLAVGCYALEYEQPFPYNTLGSELFRIPALLTLQNGSVMAAVDMEYTHGGDSPQNIETVVAISSDGYTDWQYTIVNSFDDYPAGVSDEGSASFIDPALIQSDETGRIFLIEDVYPSDTGLASSCAGTGCVTVDGVNYIALTDGDYSDITALNYYIGEYDDNDFALIYSVDTNEATGYSVDGDFNLYYNDEPLYMTQNGTPEQVRQNVFYLEAALTVYKTTYIGLRYSDDNGATWSRLILLNTTVKNDDETFLGICPGRGIVTTVDGTERIIFTVYDNSTGDEHMSSIYSDDNGLTWTRGERATNTVFLGKTSETQIVELPDGTLRAFARNSAACIAYADSTDGGATWSRFRIDTSLKCTANCMVSFINYEGTICGKNAIIASYASKFGSRACGVIRIGLIDDDNDIEWLDPYYINSEFFAYSCLTQLSDGSIAILCEKTENGYVDYYIYNLDTETGEISEVNGNDSEEPEYEFSYKLKLFLLSIVYKIASVFYLL